MNGLALNSLMPMCVPHRLCFEIAAALEQVGIHVQSRAIQVMEREHQSDTTKGGKENNNPRVYGSSDYVISTIQEEKKCLEIRRLILLVAMALLLIIEHS